MQDRNTPYGLEPAEDALDYSEARVVNITDEEVKFTIATTPGAKPRRYTLAPFGKPGCDVHLQEGYTKPYRGAGRKMIRPIIESRTLREPFPGARLDNSPDPKEARPHTLPMVVHEDNAKAARKAWLAAMAKAPKRAPQPAELDDDDELDDQADVGSGEPAIASGPPAAPKSGAKGKA